jgi:hypothetical protein
MCCHLGVGYSTNSIACLTAFFGIWGTKVHMVVQVCVSLAECTLYVHNMHKRIRTALETV